MNCKVKRESGGDEWVVSLEHRRVGRNDVIEAHGYGMRFRLTIVSIHVAKVQIHKRITEENQDEGI